MSGGSRKRGRRQVLDVSQGGVFRGRGWERELISQAVKSELDEEQGREMVVPQGHGTKV